jgi:hypothetical protein
MLKIYQVVMAVAAVMLGALCLYQRLALPAHPSAPPYQSNVTIVNVDWHSPTSPLSAGGEAHSTTYQSNSTIVGLDWHAEAADIVTDLLTNRKRLDTIRAFSSPELDSLYAPLFRSLGLAPEDIDVFKDLITARRIAQAELRIREQNAETDAELLALQEQRTRAMDWFDERMREVLGTGDFESLEGYEKSLAERTMLFDYKQGLDNLGRGLTYEQEDRLIRLMYDERSSVTSLDALFSGGDSTFDDETDALVRDFDAWADRVLLKCAYLLDEDQLKALKAQLDAQQRALERFFKDSSA